jgi:hypothetical protein
MPEHLRLDRNDPDSAPEDAVTESWVEAVDIYLTIPAADTRRTPRARVGRRASAKQEE